MHTFFPLRLSFVTALLVISTSTPTFSRADNDPAATVSVTSHGLTVTVDPRIELLSVVQRLSDYRGFQGRPVLTQLDFPYTREIDTTFAHFAGHPAVSMFKEMSGHGFWYSHPPTAMLHLSNPPALEQERPYTDLVLMTAGGAEKLDNFIGALRSFCRETRFMDFYAAHRDMYQTMIGEYLGVMERNYVRDIEEYYGTSLGGYTIILVPLFHPGGFGPRLQRPDGTFEAYYLGGPKEVVDGFPSFGSDDNIRYLCWHEFSHSFVNHLTERRLDEFREPVAILDPRTRQAITDDEQWEIHVADWISEHIVRGVTTRLAYSQFGHETGREMGEFEVSQGFPHVPDVASRLATYETNRGEYPTLESFYPELVRLFNELAAARRTTQQ